MRRPSILPLFFITLALAALLFACAVAFSETGARRRLRSVLPPRLSAPGLAWTDTHYARTDCYSSLDRRSSCPVIIESYAVNGDAKAAADRVRGDLGLNTAGASGIDAWRVISHYRYGLYVYDDGNGSIRIEVQEYDLLPSDGIIP